MLRHFEKMTDWELEREKTALTEETHVLHTENGYLLFRLDAINSALVILGSISYHVRLTLLTWCITCGTAG